MSPIYQVIFTIFLSLGLAACGGSGDKDGDKTSNSSLSDNARFDREMRKNGCELLTAAQVSKTFDVPAESLRQMKVMGCRYGWNNDNTTLEAAISMIRAHKSETAADRWFVNATRSRTAEEMKADMAKISKRMDQRKELDTEAKKSAAKGLLSSIASKAIIFEDLDGIGENARINEEGNIYVRVDNLTFVVSAYKGAKAPPPDMAGVDLRQMVGVVQKSAAQWSRQTAPQRRKDGIRLAKVIVDEM